MNIIEPIEIEAALTRIQPYLRDLQDRICAILQQQDPALVLQEDPWQHQGGGGGITRAFSAGDVIEKAGVNFSHVYGTQLPPAATQKRPELQLGNCRFQALGVSLVIHPRNPYVPTTHANLRFIVLEQAGQVLHWWFGGGFDLTPYYGFQEDCEHWHRQAKAACDPFGLELYPRLKKWCDEYFYLKHRQESRGIGGLFYDDFNNLLGTEWDFETCLRFTQSVGEHFIKAYEPILLKRQAHPYTSAEREFQAYRRGRYVEFNLLYDRGTLFGLQSSGRTESILMSLPPLVNWRYDWQPAKNSEEARLYEHYLKPQAWI